MLSDAVVVKKQQLGRRMRVRQAVLKRAVEVLGSTSAVAARLGVSDTIVRGWLDGRPIPDAFFLRATDLVFETQLRSLAAHHHRRTGTH